MRCRRCQIDTESRLFGRAFCSPFYCCRYGVLFPLATRFYLGAVSAAQFLAMWSNE